MRYQTLEFRTLDLHVRTLRDKNQFEDEQGQAEAIGISSASWPIFGVIWDSAIVLADLMLDHPADGLRVLEVGCGIGLASLVLNHRSVDITATDRHPEAKAFLDTNVALNGGSPIPFVRASWDEPAPELGTFDLIIGSDLLYEPYHPSALTAFIQQHGRAHSRVIMVDGGRGHKNRFARHMAEIGYACETTERQTVELRPASFDGHVMQFER